LVVHGLEDDVTVTLPAHEGVAGYSLLWDSSVDEISDPIVDYLPGSQLTIPGTSMRLFRAH
jgi:glycogen operon protein